MFRPTQSNKHKNSIEIENIIGHLKNNVECAKRIITKIDGFLETKQIPESILDDLISQRNACAVNVMNFTRVMTQIR